jgi:4-aminobutyrate aminotransferase/(S)-3-amino-2-methylpropionate transaminase
MEPSTKSEALSRTRANVIAKGYAGATATYVERAAGALIFDVEGREYIDFAGGIAVMNVGHSHPKVVAAIQDQAGKFTHTCFMVLPYAPAIELADKLCRLVPGNFDKAAMFINSGAEAVENAVKIARYASGRTAIICFENAFHGRTLMGMSLTSKVKPYKFGFGPFAPEIYRMPFAYCYRCPFGLTYPGCDTTCADHLESFLVSHVAPESTAAVIVEPIQGEGGFITPPPEYFPKLKRICENHGILLIADEIQTGIGRTGRMFAMEHWGVEADITTVAKSLAAGLPLSAVVGRKDLMDSVHASGIGGTYGANPLACRAALAVLDIFENEDLLSRGQALGEKLRRRFDRFQADFEVVGDVRGIGPMLALELVRDRESKEPATDAAKQLVRYCHDKGLILLACGTHGNVIRVLMPLVITDTQLEKGLSIMSDGLAALTP